MKDPYAMMALFCHKTQDCSDKPLIVIVGKTGQTGRVIYNPNCVTREDLNKFEDYKYNGIVKYTITISEQEYEERFKPFARNAN
jgi:hypothetical protein